MYGQDQTPEKAIEVWAIFIDVYPYFPVLNFENQLLITQNKQISRREKSKKVAGKSNLTGRKGKKNFE